MQVSPSGKLNNLCLVTGSQGPVIAFQAKFMENSGNIKQSLLDETYGRWLGKAGEKLAVIAPGAGWGQRRGPAGRSPLLPTPHLLQMTVPAKRPCACEPTTSLGQLVSVKRPSTSKRSASYWPKPSSPEHSQRKGREVQREDSQETRRGRSRGNKSSRYQMGRRSTEARGKLKAPATGRRSRCQCRGQ